MTAKSALPTCGSQCPEHPEHQCQRSPLHTTYCRDEKQKGTQSCDWDPRTKQVIR